MEVPKSFCLWYPFFILAGCIVRLTIAYHQGKCEISRGRHRLGTNHAMLGHSYKNFSLFQAYDCHVKCFEEKCRCRAYQIWQKRCELLDEDRFSAPNDFVNDAEYTYFDMNREFANLVRQTLKLLMIFTLVLFPYVWTAFFGCRLASQMKCF